MSLSRLALRIVTIAALRGRTLAGDAVRDSAFPALDCGAQEESHLILAVYTDDGNASPRNGDLLSGQAVLSLVIESAVAICVPSQGTWVIPATDAEKETTLDLLDRQIRRALMDPDTPWSRLWRGLVAEVTAVAIRPSAREENGQRPASRQLEIQVTTLADPRPGHTATGVWADLLAELEADASLAPVAPLLRAEIEGEAPSPQPDAWPRHWEHDAGTALGHEMDDPRAIAGSLETVVTTPNGYATP